MKGKVLTVLGPVEPDTLGLTLTHEHLLCEWFKEFKGLPLPAKVPLHKDAPFCMENLGWIRQYPYSFTHNFNFEDEETRNCVRAEMEFFKKSGGSTIVDNCSVGVRAIGQAEYLTNLSAKTGINIIAGTGFYEARIVPKCTHNMSVEDMTNTIRQEILTGMCDTDVKCGVIGEVGCGWPLVDFEKRSLAATGIVQQETGAPVIFHPGRNKESPKEMLRVFSEAGGNISNSVMSHLDRTFHSKEDLLEFAEMGSYCEYDLFGVETSYYQLNEDVSMPSDARRMELIHCLIREGYDDRIVLGHDIFSKHRLMQFGGHGYSHIIVNVIPQMKRLGITEDEIHKMMFDNPRRWLTFK